jgi:hypothetical protein
MATLNPGILFTGSLGGLSAYKMKGSDKIILRTKGGPSKKQVHSMPENSLLRLNNKEWNGCVITGTNIRKALHGLLHLADYNISGQLNGLAKTIQKLDTVQACGQRSILVNQYKHRLTGFSLNRNILFDSMVRYPLQASVNRNNGHAQVQIPMLEPGIHLKLNRWPLFRFCITLGVVPDVLHNATQKIYEPALITPLPIAIPVTGAWWPSNETYTSELLEISLNDATPVNEHLTLVAGIGIEMGQMTMDGAVEPVKFGGSAKVIGVG